MDEFSDGDEDDRNSFTTFNRQTCPISCDDSRNEEEQSLSRHYLTEKHQRTVIKRLQKQQFGGILENDFNQVDAGINEDDVLLPKDYETLALVTNRLETSVEACNEVQKNILESKNETLHFSKQLNVAKEECSMEMEHIKALSLNQQILQHDFASCIEEIDDDKQVIKTEPDGSMIWRITKVQEKTYDAQSERQTSIYSPPFYASIYGYRVCARLYLNGDGTARGTHASIFLVILRGKYDNILKWPFSYRVSFCLCDQRTMMETNGAIQPKHIIASFRPDISSRSFERPRSTMNIASGVPKFCSLDDLNCSNNKNLYIVNDTMYIRTFIDFLDLPRSILPFIFNMNVGLPVSIQQKLISDELKRREEQSSN